jgi:type II secretory pathway pseudopilin PulG
MENIKNGHASKQKGMTLVGLIFMLTILAMVVILASKVAPTVIEFFSIKKAIQTAKLTGNSVRDIQTSFDKQAEVGYIDSIRGRDLIIEREGDSFEVSFEYTKKIPLMGPATLLLEYQGTTAKTKTKPKNQE